MTDFIAFLTGCAFILALVAWMLHNGYRVDSVIDCMEDSSEAEYRRCAHMQPHPFALYFEGAP